MQPKVSMVIPCYNKQEDIGHMFNTILAQKWDNIELILVNDGSTDKTRDIITEYEPHFIARGFQVVIIDQENKGLPGAVYEGLKRITGELVCTVDADDELDPEYISAMAGWLNEHEDYDFAVCRIRFLAKKFSREANPFPSGMPENLRMEYFILWRMEMNVWNYIIRTSYLKKCRIVETFYHKRLGSQEPQILLPLMAVGGKWKYIDRTLYTQLYLQPQKHHSHNADTASAIKYFDEWFVPVKETIKTLPIDSRVKERLFAIADYSRVKKQLTFKNAYLSRKNKEIIALRKTLVEMVNRYFSPSPMLAGLPPKDVLILIQAVEDCILGVKSNIKQQRVKRRVIAWGVLGRRGRRLLPLLKGSMLAPDELWDIAGNGAEVKKPDPGSLTPDDLVLVMPIGGASKSICAKIKGTGCGIMLSIDILTYLAPIVYPQFYDGSLKFEVK